MIARVVVHFPILDPDAKVGHLIGEARCRAWAMIQRLQYAIPVSQGNARVNHEARVIEFEALVKVPDTITKTQNFEEVLS